jgi:hypothetical protein
MFIDPKTQNVYLHKVNLESTNFEYRKFYHTNLVVTKHALNMVSTSSFQLNSNNE